jgi:hypothetical protein
MGSQACAEQSERDAARDPAAKIEKGTGQILHLTVYGIRLLFHRSIVVA